MFLILQNFQEIVYHFWRLKSTLWMCDINQTKHFKSDSFKSVPFQIFCLLLCSFLYLFKIKIFCFVPFETSSFCFCRDAQNFVSRKKNYVVKLGTCMLHIIHFAFSAQTGGRSLL